jgi:hypothetical protein
MTDKTLPTVIKELSQRGFTVSIVSQNAVIAKISVTKGGRTLDDLSVISNRKLPFGLLCLARKFEAGIQINNPDLDADIEAAFNR